LKTEIEQLTYKNKDLMQKLSIAESFLSDKNNEYEETVKKSNENKKELQRCQNELSELKKWHSKDVSSLQEELEAELKEVDNLQTIITTKDWMLEGKNKEIDALKAQIVEQDAKI
jgi:oligoendopeptidase F